MTQERQGTDEFVNGVRISFYLQKELQPLLDRALERYSGLYKSKSHLINCAIIRELRRLKDFKAEIETE